MSGKAMNEAILVSEAKHPEVFQTECAGGRAHIFSARCESLEGENEDAAAVIPVDAERAVLAVADGLGGLPKGGHASHLTIEHVGRALSQCSPEQEYPRTAILNAIEDANRDLIDQAAGAGTTLALVELGPEGARPYHIGDSVIYQIGGQGKLKWHSISHSPVGYAVAAGIMDETDAMAHNERHLISNMVGSEDMRIEIGPHLQLAKMDTLLLASDGLTDNLHLEEIIEFCRKRKPEDALESLATAAMERMQKQEAAVPGKPDDCTIILFRPN